MIYWRHVVKTKTNKQKKSKTIKQKQNLYILIVMISDNPDSSVIHFYAVKLLT